MKLIPNWRDAWRLWSVRLAAAAAVLQALTLAWAELPAEWRAMAPEPIGSGIVLITIVAAIGARLVKQGAFDADAADEDPADV